MLRLKPGLELILASGSPRRAALLHALGLEFSVVTPACGEPAPAPGILPAQYARECARLKAESSRAAVPDNGLLLAADTIVAIDAMILGKPRDAAQALQMLTLLNGRSHMVITAMCIFSPAAGCTLAHTVSQVDFHAWPRAVLEAYARSAEPLDKAGAYAIQGQGAFLADSIRGSWTNVVGLPLSQLTEILLARGLIEPESAWHGGAAAVNEPRTPLFGK